MGHIAVRGEISNCKYHSSGHIYFTLKDETGVLKAVMFRGSVDKGLAFHMDVGDRVVVLGESASMSVTDSISCMHSR